MAEKILSDNSVILDYLKKNSPDVFSIVRDKLFVYDLVDSTNNEAKRRAGAIGRKSEIFDANGIVVVAKNQYAGRGRTGHSFFSPDGGLYLSAVVRPMVQPFDPAIVTATAAVCTCRAIEKCCGKVPEIKWVNDLFLNGKKICGILTEGILNAKKEIDCAVVGIGVNVRPQKNLPAELVDVVGSLDDTTTAIEFFASNLIAELFTTFVQTEKKSYNQVMDEYRTRSLVLGKKVRVVNTASYAAASETDNGFFAKVISITNEARLVVETDDGETRELSSGDISVKL